MNKFMKLFKNQKGFNNIIIIAIIVAVLGIILITGTAVWRELNKDSLPSNYIETVINDTSLEFINYRKLVSEYCRDYDRRFDCHSTCTYNNCLWQDADSDRFKRDGNKDYVFGLATIKGWYTTRDKMDRSNEEVTCNSFLIEDGPEVLLTSYKKIIIEHGNNLNSMDENGHIIVNINLSSLSEDERELMLNSNSVNPIEMIIFQKPPKGKGASTCHSAIEVFQIINSTQ